MAVKNRRMSAKYDWESGTFIEGDDIKRRLLDKLLRYVNDHPVRFIAITLGGGIVLLRLVIDPLLTSELERWLPLR